jgi:putative tryptophan/tyrosine transport system substrate-binding protein
MNSIEKNKQNVEKNNPVQPVKKVSYRIISIIILCLGIWHFFAVPEITKIPKDFYYKAEVISLDNFYDAEKGDFLGESRGVTTFTFETEKTSSEISSIRSVYDARTVDGDLIVTFDELYNIDRKTGKYIFEEGVNQGDVFLFAPKGLEKGESYEYLPINYGYPTTMSFVQEDVLFGLNVYEYESRFPDLTVDHTDFLTHVPGVGVDRGVVLDPYLRIWIEPVTGMLVNYEDGATSYYYDLSTGEKINPRNKFSNKIERSSVKERVVEVKGQKTMFTLVRIVIPLSVLLFVMLFYLGFHYKRRKLSKIILLIWIASISIFFFTMVKNTDEKIIRVGISTWVQEQEFRNNIDSFKETLENYGYVEGKNIEYHLESADTDINKQKKIARKFKEMNLDLIYSLTTPGTTFISNEIIDVPIVFSVVTYPVESGLIYSLQNSKNNLVGSRNWVSESKQLDSALKVGGSHIKSIAFVHRKGESNSKIQFNKMLLAAEGRGIHLIDIAVSSLNEAKEELNRITADAVYTSCDTLIQSGGEEVVIEYAKERNIPSFACGKSGVELGALSGLVVDFDQIGHIAGEKAVLILNGATPASLETLTAARPFLFINITTATELGVDISQSLYTKVREFIE